MDKSSIYKIKTISIIISMLNEYQSSDNFNTSEAANSFLKRNKFNELGHNNNDDIINSLFNKDLLQYSPESLLPATFEKGSSIESANAGKRFLNKWEGKINSAINKNSAIKELSFIKSLNLELHSILDKKGGLTNSLQFLRALLGQFDFMKDEMNSESNNHKTSIINHKKGLTVLEGLIKDEESDLLSWVGGKRELNIKEECQNYASKIELILNEKFNALRKYEAGLLILKIKKLIDNKILLFEEKSISLTSVLQMHSHEVKKATRHLEDKDVFTKDLSKEASESISISSERLIAINDGFNFGEHLSNNDSGSNLRNDLEDYVTSLDEIKYISKMTVEEVIENQTKQKIESDLDFLEVASSPAGVIDESFAYATNAPNLVNVGYVTTSNPAHSVILKNKENLNWQIGDEKIVPTSDSERITMVQCEGPFPINALTSLRKSKTAFERNENMVTGKVFSFSDQFFAKNAQDLYKSDTVKDAQVFFGIGSALKIIECTTSKYIIHINGDEKDLSSPGARNKKDRDHAFNYFKKVDEYVKYIKSEYESEQKKDPVNMKKLFIEHFDTIFDTKVIRKKKNSCSLEELSLIKKERCSVANFALDNGLLQEIDYMQRKSDDGIIREMYSSRELRNIGLNI